MPETTTDLRISVEQPASWSRRVSITVPGDRVKRVRKAVAAQLSRSVRLPGFRKGHMPASLLEKQFAGEIEQRTIDQLVQDAYREALDAHGLNPITQGQVDNVKLEEDGLSFDVEFEVQPEVELSQVTGFHAERPAVEVGEAQVDEVVERIRNDRGTWADLGEGETPATGDRVTVEMSDRDAEEAEEPRPYRFVLGEGQAIPGVEDAIGTLSAGGEGDFDVAYPEDFPDEELRGKEQHLHIRLVRAERKTLPEMDDALAQSLGEFDDVAALRARILSDLTEQSTKQAEEAVRAQLVQQILDANPFEVPGSMVERYLDFMSGEANRPKNAPRRTGADAERISQVRALVRPQAEAALKRLLLVEKLADREGLRATTDDVDARVETLAEQAGRSPSEVWVELERSGQMSALENEITEEKVFAWLLQQNNVA
jgi:trigger factor